MNNEEKQSLPFQHHWLCWSVTGKCEKSDLDHAQLFVVLQHLPRVGHDVRYINHDLKITINSAIEDFLSVFPQLLISNRIFDLSQKVLHNKIVRQ